MNSLPVVPLKGLNADSLGAYLAALGLFSVAARRWPSVRACWRNAGFCLVGGPIALDEIVEFLSEVGEKNAWTPYDKPWDKDKRADVDKKTSMRTERWRAFEAEERSLPAFGAHLALDGRVKMNPLLGKGGNAGQRKFDRGWSKAVARIGKPPRGQSRESLRKDIEAFLDGKSCAYLGDFSAGSWFGTANKIYNHGTRRAFRKGEITPWAMVLACEGLPYFSGGVSRRLGSRRQPQGAFPFITTAMAPQGADEAGSIEAEVWAPIWNQPMTGPELQSLFLRGRAELGGRGATSSAKFAVGATSRGVDAGISEFRRFLLMHTTSKETFESRLATVVPVPKTNPDGATIRAIRTIDEFHDKLPEDQKGGKRGRFFGVRGPLEQALVDFAAAEAGEGRTESAWALVDEMFEALIKVDRNRTFRTRDVRFRFLPAEWAARLFRDDPPARETRLALAISSLSGTPSCPPVIAYRIGVQRRGAGAAWEFPESSPGRRVWGNVGLADNLCATAERRIMETLQNSASRLPFGSTIRVDLGDLHSWLTGDMDEERLSLWLDRLCMFDWDGEAEAAKEIQRNFPLARPVVDGVLALYALFRPLANDWLFRQVLHESSIQAERVSTCAWLGRVVAMLRRGDVNAAAEVALAAYRSAGVTLADFGVLPDVSDPGCLLAALAIPARDEQTLAVFQRWQTPTDPNQQ